MLERVRFQIMLRESTRPTFSCTYFFLFLGNIRARKKGREEDQNQSDFLQGFFFSVQFSKIWKDEVGERE